MNQLLALAMIFSFIPSAVIARVPDYSNVVSPTVVQDDPPPAPASSPTPDVEMDEEKRRAALAEEKKKREVAEKDAAEARRARLKAETEPLGDPTKVAVPTGGVTTDDRGFVEVEMLSKEASRDITRRLTESLCASDAFSKGDTLVIYNSSEMAGVALYRSMVKQLRKFNSDFSKAEAEFVRVDSATNPKSLSADALDLVGLGAIAIPGVVTGIVKSVAELINLFRTDTEFKNKDVAIPEDMVVSYLVSNLREQKKCKPSVYYPSLYTPELFRDDAESALLGVLGDLGKARAKSNLNIQKVDARIKFINSIASMIEERVGKAKEKNAKEVEKKELLQTDRACRRPKCVKLTKEIADLETAIKKLNENINEETSNHENGFLSQYKEWLGKLKELKTLTQLLIDSTDQITSKLNLPDETTKLTAMAQLLKAEQLDSILKSDKTFTLRVAITANGTTKIKKNLFVDAKVRHSAGANLVYQLFDHRGRVVLGDGMQFYFDYRSAAEVRALVSPKPKPNGNSGNGQRDAASGEKGKKESQPKTTAMTTSPGAQH